MTHCECPIVLAAAVLGCVLAVTGAEPTAARGSDGPSPLGLWFTGDRKGMVEIGRCGADLCGRIVWIDPAQLPADVGATPLDVFNPEPSLRDRPLCGVTILSGFRLEEQGLWTGGRIYDPDRGETYRSRLTMAEPDTLTVRGYVLMPWLGRSQTWQRVPPAFRDRCQP